jgi:hypothetical protein
MVAFEQTLADYPRVRAEPIRRIYASGRARSKISIDSISLSHIASIRFPLPQNRPDAMEADMAKYLFEVSYTAQRAKGFLEGGGGKRRAATEQAAGSSTSTSPSATPMPLSSPMCRTTQAPPLSRWR